MKTVKKIMQKENGVTLVELLAAIAILSVIVTAFLAFFIQAANTNSRTDDKNEATFLAVEEMERVTEYAKNNPFDLEAKTIEMKDGYQIIRTTQEYSKIEGLEEPERFENSNLYLVTIEVKRGPSHAEMQTVIPFAE